MMPCITIFRIRQLAGVLSSITDLSTLADSARQHGLRCARWQHFHILIYDLHATLLQNPLCQVAKGISVLLGYDPAGIGSYLMKVFNGCRKTETILVVALALERVSTIRQLKTILNLVDVVTVLAWTYGFVNFGLLCSPWADFHLNPTTYGVQYNKALPLTDLLEKVSFYSSVVCAAITFLLYVSIIAYLVHRKLAMKTVKFDINEKAIFMQALIRFLGDLSAMSLGHVIPMFTSVSASLGIATSIGYILNYLVFPPIFSIVVSRSLREAVFPCRKKFEMSVTPVVHK
uniref:G protein-coupled receptor n=1 Tax=Steinernema glaseri TaxID=37863 RepID=A0A1I7YXF7_9BILA